MPKYSVTNGQNGIEVRIGDRVFMPMGNYPEMEIENMAHAYLKDSGVPEDQIFIPKFPRGVTYTHVF